MIALGVPMLAWAEVGFRSVSPWERLLNPSFSPYTIGFASSPWDTSRRDTAGADSAIFPPPDSAKVESADTSLTDFKADFDGADADTGAKPPPYHPTIVQRLDLPLEQSASLDTATQFVIIKHRLSGADLPMTGALEPDSFLARAAANSDWERRRAGVLGRLPKSDEAKGKGISISIPVFTSKRAERIFGGRNVKLTVTGDISVNGSLRTERREELQANNPNPTSYQFKVDQTQRFNIKGNVGEKVEVSIDQDSERLFEFENSLRVTYTGNPDEIVQKVEAGNVNLSLPGTQLVSASTKHSGLFGLKTESRVGALKLTTIASLDKGEKHTKTIKGGAESGRPISLDPRDYIRDRYFFLDFNYRENSKHRDPTTLLPYAMPESMQIVDIEVYKSVRSGGENYNAIPGWALFRPQDGVPDSGATAGRDKQQATFLRLEPGTDYSVVRELGYIRMNQSLQDDDVLAVAYTTRLDTVGHIRPPVGSDSTNFVLKLLRPRNPVPTDSTWRLMWRNVYDLRSTGINPEGFEGRIVYATGTRSDIDTSVAPNRPFIELFGLDRLGSTGEPRPDGQIDGVYLQYGAGELTFPDPTPFAPEGWFLGPGVTDTLKAELGDSALYSPWLYTRPYSEMRNLATNLRIEVKYKSISATINLGSMVLEGSEEVTLNGRRLNRGSDYTVDYITGTLTFLTKEAIAADADLEIKYETGQLFQLDTKTMLGVRAEYELWEDSFIGTTAMFLNQKGLDQRARLAAEPPMRNSIWDINTRLTFKPEFLTLAVDALPLIETAEESRFEISAEFAQVFPNPNTLNSPATGDNDGVAYIDDFESVKRSMSLGTSRRQWTMASFPSYDTRGQNLWLKQRGRIIWYNPWDQVKITDIWPEREVQAQESTMPVFRLEFQPWWSEWGAAPAEATDPVRSWGGVMRYLGAGFGDQTQSKFIEVWMHRGSMTSGEMVIDLGLISEDVIPNGKLDSEDRPLPGQLLGNNTLDSGEDIGVDGRAGADPSDMVDIDGTGVLKPAFDDYTYRISDRYNYSGINGTEGNAQDEGGHNPDTEDLNGDAFLNQANSFFRYRINLDEGDGNRYIAGGLGNPKGWRLYRIPLKDTLRVGDPSFSSIEYVRIWFTGMQRRGACMIASVDIVGNEWQEVVERSGDVEYEPVSLTVINTHDNPEYEPPPGVSGEIDPVSGLRAQEQALVMRINRLGTGQTGRAYKHMQTSLDMLEYSSLKMFVHGGGADKNLKDRLGNDLDLEMFVRFGRDTSRNYYEYSQRVLPGWHPNNEIDIDLARLASLKFLREQDSLRNYDILPDGDVIRVIGEASLSEVRYIVIGVKNHGPEINAPDNVELWLDEMRVSGVNRDPGWAARGAVSLQLADLMDIRADLTQQQADFHNVNQRKGSNADELSGSTSLTLKLDKVFDPKWGIRFPVSLKADQNVSIPKYKPGSDIRLAALTDQRLDVWDTFAENMSSNRLIRDNPAYKSPVDSLITIRKGWSYSVDYSKTKRSENPFIAMTVDRTRLRASHSETWAADHNTQYRTNKQNRGEASWEFAFEKPLEIGWLGWAGFVPVLKKVADSKLQPLPSSVSLSSDGTETFDLTKSRRGGRVTDRYNFALDRNFGLGWRPLSILNFDYRQEVNADRVRDDTLRTTIARRVAVLDSAGYRSLGPDSLPRFDSLRYREDFEKKVKEKEEALFWDLFGAKFLDRGLSQSLTMSFNPRFVGWLTTDMNYNSRYRWDWGQSLGRGDRTVSVSSQLSTSTTLRLQQIFASLRQSPGLKPDGPEPRIEDFFQRGGQWKDKPVDKPADKPPLPAPPDGGLEPIFDDAGPAPKLPVPSDTLNAEVKLDSAKSVKPAKPRPNPLKLLAGAASRLRDLRWDYTLSNDKRHFAVEEGQAKPAYRLGLVRDPGLGKAQGPLGQRDNFTRRDDHRFTTGLEITRTLSLSTIGYNYTTSRSASISPQTQTLENENGTISHTAFPYFGSDGVSVETLPLPNWTARWSGLGELAWAKKAASSVSVENSFQGSKLESWKKNKPEEPRAPTRFEYERNFSPLLGLTINWLGGIGSNIRYNWTQRITAEVLGLGAKSRSTTRTISLTANYTSRQGFSIPIPVWPFKNRRFKNNTTFALNFSNNLEKRETAGTAGFAEVDLTQSWSLSPSVEYSFSESVRGGFQYEYAQRNSKRIGKTKSQEFSFRVNISIRG